jgi:putative ABC transport system permease protein
MASHRAMMEDPRRFGNTTRLREENADVWGWTWVDAVSQDLRHALRLLNRSPAFSAVAIATLAVGIGASTAIFSVAYGVSLRPLPYAEPERLIRIFEMNPAEGRLKQNVSEGTFQEWREGVPSIEAVIYSDARPRFLANSNEPITIMSVGPNFFDVLGIKPILGRGFKTEKEYGRSSDEAILSHGAWQRFFGGRTDIIGTRITLRGAGDNDVIVVIGVMPEDFSYGQPADLWMPFIVRIPIPRIVRTWRYDHVLARLRPGATVDQARSELETVAARIARDHPASNAGWTVAVEPLHDTIIANFGRATWLLLAAVALVLFITCVNVAGLLLARAVARERETAVRQALGAPHSRLLRLWVSESVLLATLGTGLGLLLAWSGIAALKAAAPPGIPRLDAIMIDVPVLVVAVASAFLAMVVIAGVPLRVRPASRPLVNSLRTGSAAGGDAKHRQVLREAVISAQCVGAVALVIMAVMLGRSFMKLVLVDLGWNASGILTMHLQPPLPARIPWFQYVEWSDRLIEHLEATPGIEAAAITTSIPLSPQTVPVVIGKGRGKAVNDDARWSAIAHNVTDGYFKLMGISLISGRTFGPEDRFSEEMMTIASKRLAQPGVAIVSQRLAQVLWPGRSPIGESLWLPDLGDGPWREVVGVVEDIQFHAVDEDPTLHVFVPWTQRSTGNPFLLVKRTGAGNAASITSVVRQAVEAVQPGTGIDRVTSLDALVARGTAQPRFTAQTVSAFGVLALVLTTIGIYGTLSYLVESRTREIAIRLTLGASRGVIVSEVLKHQFWPVVIGGLIGVAIAVALARIFESLLFQIESLDFPSFLFGAALLLIASLAASLAPTFRVLRVDPSTTLRAE